MNSKEAMKKKILVIYNAKPLAQDIAELLNLSSFEAIWRSNGNDGLAAVYEFRPDLILCDMMMLGEDGYSVLEQLRRDPLRLTFFCVLGQRATI
jgi:CheY-like chemotaxis protein